MVFADHQLRDVEVASLQLRRIYRVMRETLRAMCGHVPSSPSHPVKRLLASHAWIDALNADALRIRVLELRYPRVDVDDDMPPAWLELLSYLPRVKNSKEFLTGYSVVKPRVISAIEHYIAGSDAIDDAPSHLILKRALDELKMELQEAEAIVELLPAFDRGGGASWATYKLSFPTGYSIRDPHTGHLLCSSKKSWLLLKLITDDPGIVGWGEGSGEWLVPAVEACFNGDL